MFSGSTVPFDSKETLLGSSNQVASPSAVRNPAVVLLPSRVWKCVSTVISGSVDIPEVPGYHSMK